MGGLLEKIIEIFDQLTSFSEKLIDWYLLNHRDLPWRKTRDPYAIWLSETILQQTRVSQGLSYYYRFLERFPDVSSLANASQEEVLALWQGLGYYSRGRNLHSTAKEIMVRFNGQFPKSHSEILSLKGIGDYSAAAICSFAYHQDFPVIDGNVIRVMARLFEIDQDIRKTATRKLILDHLTPLFPLGQSYLFNQAIMELGALICLPQRPNCFECPIHNFCQAQNNNTQSNFPFKSKPTERKKRFLNYLLVEYNGEYFFKKRDNGIWNGLYEPLLLEDRIPFSNWSQFSDKAVEGGIFLPEKITIKKISKPEKQILTHQELWISVCHIMVYEKPDWDGKWVEVASLDSLPKSVFFLKFFARESPEKLPLMFNKI